MWSTKDINHTSSWIYNWCIWRNVWDITYNKKLNLETNKKQSQNFKKYVKLHEFTHIKNIKQNRNNINQKKNEIKDETSLFKFYNLDPNFDKK